MTVVAVNTALYGYAATLQGIEEAARSAGLAVGVRVVESDHPTDVRLAAEHVSDPNAGGVVVIAFDAASAEVLRTLPADVPAVPAVAAMEAGGLAGIDRSMVFLDERHAIPPETGTSARQSGWRAALDEAGAPVPEVLRVEWDVRSAYLAGQRLAADPAVTAVLCGNDETALAVRRALYEAGRDVPGGRQHHRVRRRARCRLPLDLTTSGGALTFGNPAAWGPNVDWVQLAPLVVASSVTRRS